QWAWRAMMVMMRSSAMAAPIQHSAKPVRITRVSTVVSISVSFAVRGGVCCGVRVWGRSGVGLPPVEPSHALGDDGRAGLAVGGGACGLGRCVVALDGEGARLATVRVRGGRSGCPSAPVPLCVLLGGGGVQVIVEGVHH